MTTMMNCLSETSVCPMFGSNGFAQTQVWGKHSAWLSAPRAAAALGVGSAGRSPHPLPTGGRPEP